jgi:hypothetical protein
MAGHVVGVQRTAAEGADFGDRRGLVVAEEGAHLARMGIVGRGEVAVLEGPPVLPGCSNGSVRSCRQRPSGRGHGALAEFLVQVGDQVGARVGGGRVDGLALVGAGGVQVGLIRFGRGEEVEDVLQAVLDGPEIRAIAPALADVEGRLAEAALLGSTWRMSVK